MAPRGRPPALPQLTDAVLLGDGRGVTFRAILPSDSLVLERLFHRLSSESLFRRFLAPVPRPPHAMVQRLVQVALHDGVYTVRLQLDSVPRQA